jgi:ribonuclease Z
MKGTFTVLGSNSALPTSERFSSAHVLQMHGRFFLIDCAEGTQILLRKNKFSSSAIDNIFITHLHGDHYLGLFGLLSSFNMLGRKKDIHIYGPPKLQEIIDFHVRFIENEMLFNIIFHSIDEKTSIVYEDKVMTIMAFPMKHRIPTFGFLFKEKQKPRNVKRDSIAQYEIPIKEIRNIKEGADFVTSSGEVIPNSELTHEPSKVVSFAFCSDTKYNENIIPIIAEVDLLYHEATFTDEFIDRAKQTYHSTAKQAATIALKANVKKLAIGHFSARFKDTTLLEQEAQSIFPETFAVYDGMKIEIS